MISASPISVAIRLVLDREFRASDSYALVPYASLTIEQQAWLRGIEALADLYGILRPRSGSRLAIKAIDRCGAALFTALARPGRVPAAIIAELGGDANRTVASLVLDGILELDTGDAFVSGLGALAHVVEDVRCPEPRHRLAELSLEALAYAEQLDVGDLGALSARLYFFHRLPSSPHWQRRLPDTDAIEDFVGIRGSSSLRSLLSRHWKRVTSSRRHDGWLFWAPLDDDGVRAASARFKLYVSPAPDYLPDAVGAVVDTLADTGPRVFKIGNDAHGVLRPDKLVVYFESEDEVRAVAARLAAALSGCPAHGVPFTADLGGDGLLSCGVDPPHSERLVIWQERESWRLWITNRLASTVVAARPHAASDLPDPRVLALARLALDGIDVSSWTPDPHWISARESP